MASLILNVLNEQAGRWGVGGERSSKTLAHCPDFTWPEFVCVFTYTGSLQKCKQTEWRTQN